MNKSPTNQEQDGEREAEDGDRQAGALGEALRQGEATEKVGVRQVQSPDRDWSEKTGDGVYLL